MSRATPLFSATQFLPQLLALLLAVIVVQHPLIAQFVSTTGLLAFALVVGTRDAVLPTMTTTTLRTYEHYLTLIDEPSALLADHPEFCEPVREQRHFEAPPLVNDEGANLHVRAWRYSYNARGIIEVPNHLRSSETAVIVVHPWGIDEGQGWVTPEPAGVAFFCTTEKNAIVARHEREVVRPFLNSLRDRAAFVMYSLPGREDPIRKQLYRSFTYRPSAAERQQGARDLKEKFARFDYGRKPLTNAMSLSTTTPASDYLRQFPSRDGGADYNGDGYWYLPIPVSVNLDAHPDDIVIYDQAGYAPLRSFLRSHGVRNVLLAGYAIDMCLRETTAGYDNLARDFNVFLVGDASLATFPGNNTPRFATNAALCQASLHQLITQVSWIHLDSEPR